MKMVSGAFNGTGAAVYLCLGFVPDWVRIYSSEDAEGAHLIWGRQFRAAESNNGSMRHGTGQAITLYTAGLGIEPYEGGDLLTSANQTSTGYGEGVYLGWDGTDYRQDSTYGYIDAVIDTWTLTTSGTRKGKFNDDVPASGSRIGEGSEITIRETGSGITKKAIIEAVAAGAGKSDDEVTLSRAIASGEILRISGMYSLAPIAVGKTTPAGFKLNVTTDINVDGEIQYFEAAVHD